MTRKHIEAIAAALLDAKPTYDAIGDNEEGTYAWESCCQLVAASLRGLNPKFDTARFLRDCGVTS